MAPLSANVNAGDDVLASQYNNLRTDVLDPDLGHKHTGLPGEGAAVPGSLLVKPGTLTGDGSDGDLTVAAPTTFDQFKQFNNLILDSSVKPVASRHFLVIAVAGTLTINSGGILDVSGFGGAGGIAPDGTGGDGHQPASIATLTGEIEGGRAESDGLRSMAQAAAIADAGEDLFFAYGAGGGGGSNDVAAGSGGNGGDLWSGGGAGSRNDAGGGGGVGGVGGGCIVVLANTIIVNAGGIIRANGAQGAAKGGHGGGGLVYLAYKSLTNNGLIEALGANDPGGAGVRPGDGGEGLVVEKIIPG